MTNIEQVLQIHQLAIQRFGGSDGVRDKGLLESAISRPFATFEGNDLYPTIFKKAAAIAESIIINHPFVDGNKRTGYLLMEALLRTENLKIIASDIDLYDFVIAISTGSLSFEEIVTWLKDNCEENKSL